MLFFFRQKNIRRNVLWAVSGIIIISFGFGFGISQFSGEISLTDTAGKAFGRRISIKEYKDHYAATTDQAILVHGENYKRLLPFIDMDNETWTRLLLVKEAERRNIQVSDGEVIAHIQGFPFFHRDGRFSQELYQNILKYLFRRNARQFEEGVRDQIKIVKLMRTESGPIRLSPEMIRKEYERRNQETQASYVLIDPAKFTSGVTIDTAQAKAYYETHRDEFQTPDAVKVSYITLRLGEKATEDEKAATAERTSAIFTQLTQGADFNKVSQAEGLAVKETGFFSMENPDISEGWSFEVFQNIFAAPKGEVLPPVNTIAGIQILKITDLKPSAILEFKDAEPLAKEKLLAAQTLELAETKANEILPRITEGINQGQAFDQTALALGLEAKTTPFFILGDYIPDIGISQEFQETASSLNADNRLGPVVKTPRGPVIIYWEETRPIDEQKFTEVKADFETNLLEERRIAAMNKTIKEVREKAGFENYLDKKKK